MNDDHDRIDLTIDVRAPAQTVWDLVSRPGWYINDGELVEHDIDWDGSTATVSDPDHGTFRFTREASVPPRHLADRNVELVGRQSGRLVEFWVTGERDTSTIRVVESGFAAMSAPVDEQRRQHAQNTTTWRQQLMLARARLEGRTP